jgi:hypothetical protein
MFNLLTKIYKLKMVYCKVFKIKKCLFENLLKFKNIHFEKNSN